MTATLSDIPLKTITGEPAKLADYKGKVLLVVNVASKCGLTPQYEGLQKLYEEKHGEGLEILGFPANDFRGQEPGTEEEISTFCSTTYNVTFPLFSKIEVTGENIHPLYAGLIAAKPKAAGGTEFRDRLAGYGMTPNPEPGVLWNFEKFLIGRDGTVIDRFTPDTTADDPKLRAVVDKALTA
jgi:glutathione peroxidase